MSEEIPVHEYRKGVKNRETSGKSDNVPETNKTSLNSLKTGKRKKQPEYQLQKQVCAWFRLQFPHTLFMSDTIAATRLTFSQQHRNKAIQCSGFHCPDLIIFEPKGIYHGLFIELKVESPYKKDGTIKKSTNDHLYNQYKTIQDLQHRGYFATFSYSFDMTIKIIEDYMNLHYGSSLITFIN